MIKQQFSCRQQNRRYVELLIFDLDGTLIDSRQDIANAVNFTLSKFGIPEKSMQEISSYIGMGVGNLIRKSLGQRQDIPFNKALATFEGYYRQHATDESKLFPAVEEILEYFKHKHKVIITNRNYEFAQIALKATGIDQYFSEIIGGDDIDCMKPSACPLDTAIYKLDINKQRAIMVGDMDIDVLAGKSAGILTCAVTYGIGKRQDIIKAKPDYIIDSLLDLKKIIK